MYRCVWLFQEWRRRVRTKPCRRSVGTVWSFLPVDRRWRHPRASKSVVHKSSAEKTWWSWWGAWIDGWLSLYLGAPFSGDTSSLEGSKAERTMVHRRLRQEIGRRSHRARACQIGLQYCSSRSSTGTQTSLQVITITHYSLIYIYTYIYISL